MAWGQIGKEPLMHGGIDTTDQNRPIRKSRGRRHKRDRPSSPIHPCEPEQCGGIHDVGQDVGQHGFGDEPAILLRVGHRSGQVSDLGDIGDDQRTGVLEILCRRIFVEVAPRGRRGRTGASSIAGRASDLPLRCVPVERDGSPHAHFPRPDPMDGTSRTIAVTLRPAKMSTRLSNGVKSALSAASAFTKAIRAGPLPMKGSAATPNHARPPPSSGKISSVTPDPSRSPSTPLLDSSPSARWTSTRWIPPSSLVATRRKNVFPGIVVGVDLEFIETLITQFGRRGEPGVGIHGHDEHGGRGLRRKRTGRIDSGVGRRVLWANRNGVTWTDAVSLNGRCVCDLMTGRVGRSIAMNLLMDSLTAMGLAVLSS